MSANLLRLCRRILPVVIIAAAAAARPAWAQTGADKKQDIEMAFDHYVEAKTSDQRAAIVDYIQHLDRNLTAGPLVDHIVSARNGVEATAYDDLVEALKPDGCAAVRDRLGEVTQPAAKGKLIVALRHCGSDESIHALEACLGDKRPVPFEVHAAPPRRVCDLAYDELFLKLRTDTRYGLDAGPKMNGIVSEKTPVKTRDSLIAKLKAKIAKIAPSPSPAVKSP